MGARVREFEERFAEFFGTRFAVMSNSGSSANLLAVAAQRFRKGARNVGGEIIVPAVSWGTTYYPVTQLGYRLKFVDVDLDTLNAPVEAIAAAIGPETAGVFVVNLLGNPSELAAIRALCDERGLFMLEDNCESMGAIENGRFAGAVGDIGTYSCFFSHHISTMEGGVCLTDDEELAQLMISLRAHGWLRGLPQDNHVFPKTGNDFDDSFRFVLPGYNLRPLELSGAIGVEQLIKLPGLVEARRENAAHWQSEMSGVDGFRIQREHESSSWFGFSVILEGSHRGRRGELVELLRSLEIECRPIVAGNFTRNPVLEHLPHAHLGALPNADIVHDEGLFVGNHHYDIRPQISELAAALRSF